MGHAVKRRLPAIALAALALLCYANSIRNGFVWDDKLNIVQNRFLRSWEFAPRFFTTDTAEAYSSDGEPVAVYRPLAMLTFLADFQLWGPNPVGFHLVNVLWHIAGGLLVYALLGALGIRRDLSLLAAAIFIAHPIQTENVNFIAGRNGPMAVAFMLAGLLLFVRSASVWSIIMFALALFSKETAATFPLVILAAAFLLPQPGLRRRSLLVAGAHFLALGGYLLARALVLEETGFTSRFSLPERGALALRSLATAISLVVWPSNLHHERSLPASGWLTAAGAVAIVAIAGIIVYARRRDCRIAFGLAQFLIAFSLTSNLIPLNFTFGERWLNWPLVGLLIAGSAALQRCSCRLVRAAGWAVVAAFVWFTVAQNRVWRDDGTLFETIIARGGDTARARGNLGFHYLDTGRAELARQQFEIALQRRPSDRVALRGLATIAADQQNWAEAESLFRRARTDVGVAFAQEQLGRLPEAEETLREAAARARTSLPVLKLAEFCLRQRRFAEAEQLARTALARDRMDAAAHNALGTALFRQDNLAGAEAEFRLALRYDRWMADAHANLAAVADARGDFIGALGHYNAALGLSPKNADLFYGLAALLERHGQTDDARRCLQRALELQPDFAAARQLLEKLPAR